MRNTQLLEKHYKDMQDIEFTVQEGELYMLQTRSGKRTGAGAVKIAVDLVEDGWSTPGAIQIVEPTHVDQLLHPQFKDEAAYAADVIGVGLPASPGAAVGQVVFDTETAEELCAQGKKCVLVRVETSPEDVGGMNAAEGILTARGGMTSHAAVVARGWGKTCVSGCAELVVDEENRWLSLGGVKLHEGDWVSLNGTTGEVIRGAAELAPGDLRRPRDVHVLGGRGAAPEGAGQRGHPRGRQDGARVRRRGHRARAHRAHVLRHRRAHPHRAPHDHGGRHRRQARSRR